MFSMVSKHREVILYTAFGGMTTVLNWGIYGLFIRIGADYAVANAIAFVAAILFAYVTNRRYVFESKTRGVRHRIEEFLRFLGSRFGTFLIEWAGLYVMIDWLGLTEMLPKLVMTLVVIVLNYMFSKTMVFIHKH